MTEISLHRATADDIPELVRLRNDVSESLTGRYGIGHWSANVSDKGVVFSMKNGTVYVLKENDVILATVTLSARKPWAIDTVYFSSAKRPVYLTAMAVAPTAQSKGIGRRCLEDVVQIAKGWPADAIRLDAYDAEAGAGEFYRKCGYTEMGRTIYRSVPLVYFEKLV